MIIPSIKIKNMIFNFFGHDEYMYFLLRKNNHSMPMEADYIIRYHSLYLYHSSESYDYLLDEEDFLMKNIVNDFNQFDLYTKNDNNKRHKTPKDQHKHCFLPIFQVKYEQRPVPDTFQAQASL